MQHRNGGELRKAFPTLRAPSTLSLLHFPAFVRPPRCLCIISRRNRLRKYQGVYLLASIEKKARSCSIRLGGCGSVEGARRLGNAMSCSFRLGGCSTTTHLRNARTFVTGSEGLYLHVVSKHILELPGSYVLRQITSDLRAATDQQRIACF